MTADADWERAKNDILARIGDFVPHFADLEKMGNGDKEWVTACCPFHEDHSESFTFHRKKGCWICFAGCGKGSFFDYVARRDKREFKDVLVDLAKRMDVTLPTDDTRPPIPEAIVDVWHQNLLQNEEVMNYLREKRGLNDKTLRDYKIGWDPKRQRNTIPVRDERGVVRNVRLYNAKKAQKMINHTDGKVKYGSPARLFGIGALSRAAPGSQVVLCEGEWDCLLTRQEGFLVVTGTGGCRTFRREWIPAFKGHHVVVCYDCDPEGRAAVRDVVLPALAQAEAASVKAVWLPLKGTKEEKDLSDFFKLDRTAADLQKLIDDCPVESFEKKAEASAADTEAPIELTSFCDVTDKRYVDKKIRVPITVCGHTSEDFHAVDIFKITYCPKLSKGGCFDCKGFPEACVLPPSSREYIGSCMSTDFQVKTMLREFACAYGQRPAIEILQRSTVKEFFCHQRVRRRTSVREDKEIVQLLDGVKQELIEKRVYFRSKEQPEPKSYEAVGWVKTHPKTQQVTFLIDSLKPLEEDFEAFDVAAHADEIKAFRDVGFEAMVQELIANVVRIYERDELLLTTLLTYCSPRWLRFNGDVIRGWICAAVVGDAGTGKTQTVTRISDWLELGDVFSGLSGSRTGLAYALKELKGKGWMVQVGRYPANNGRILIVDEAQHLAFEDVRTLAKAMEEGFLQIDRVRSQGFESQTRLIMLCNPRRDSVMDGFSFGAQSLSSVFTTTVIRRLDLCAFVSSSDMINTKLINRPNPRPVSPKITPSMLRSVILWAWKMKRDQIRFEDAATELCLKKSEEMSQSFGHAHGVPLVTLSDFRNKLARIAAAFAVLMVSASDDLSELVVRPLHVYAAAQLCEKLYRSDAAQLDDLSETTRENTELTNYEAIMNEFDRIVQTEQNYHNFDDSDGGGAFRRVIKTLRVENACRRDALIQMSDTSEGSVDRAVKLLKKYNLLETTRDGYVKKPKFNKFLRRYLRDRPDFFRVSDAQCDGNNSDAQYDNSYLAVKPNNGHDFREPR